MWSEYSLEVVDAVARNGSFSAAAQELHRVPSAVSYTVRQLEEWLAVPLFERRHRDVELTAAGAWFLKEGRSVVKKMQITRQQCQQIANGWRGQLAIAVDNIVRPERTRQMIVDFYRHFDDVELLVFQEVFNGVWDALSDGRSAMIRCATGRRWCAKTPRERYLNVLPGCWITKKELSCLTGNHRQPVSRQDYA